MTRILVNERAQTWEIGFLSPEQLQCRLLPALLSGQVTQTSEWAQSLFWVKISGTFCKDKCKLKIKGLIFFLLKIREINKKNNGVPSCFSEHLTLENLLHVLSHFFEIQLSLYLNCTGPLIWGFFSVNSQPSMSLGFTSVDSINHRWETVFFIPNCNLWMWRANCMHCSVPSYLETWASLDSGILGAWEG